MKDPKPAEFTGRTGYYGKQGTYFLPTSTYMDHPVYHDMKKHNPKYNYNKGLTHTNIAQNIVREEENGWRNVRDMRTLSRNFTSLTQAELEDLAKNQIDRRGRYLDFDPTTDFMPEDIDPYVSSMRATAYNPYGKLMGKPNLKTPHRVDRELEFTMGDKPKLITDDTARIWTSQSRMDTGHTMNTGYNQTMNSGYNQTMNLGNNTMNSGMGQTPFLPASRRSMPDLHSAHGMDLSQPPKSFHESQQRKAMYLGEPGQKFTYAALNSEVDNNLVQSSHPAVQPFHMRTSRSKIPTSRMSNAFISSGAAQTGFVQSSYNPNGIKPSTRLQPLVEGMFDKSPYHAGGPLPESALVEPNAIYIVHYSSRAEEWIVRYFMDSFITEKNVFRYTIPKNVSKVQVSPTQVLLWGGIKHGTRNTPSAFWGIYEWITGDLVLLPEMQIPRYGHALEFLNNEVYAIGGTDKTLGETNSVEKFNMMSQEWSFITSLNHSRTKSLSWVSHESNTIYVAGGTTSRNSALIIERYSPLSNNWQEIEVSFNFKILPERTHMIIYNEEIRPAPDTKSAGNYDPDDKLLFIHYDNIIYPVPDIYFLSLGQGVIEELNYDKTNSTVSTYYKQKVIYDKQLKKVIAFSGSNYTVADYIDINEEFWYWKSFEFSS